MRKRLWIGRGFPLTRTAIFGGVAGLGKSILPLLRLWTWSGFLAVDDSFVVGVFGGEMFAHNRSSPCNYLVAWGAGFDEPQPVIGAAGNFGKQVCRVGGR